MSEYNFRTAGTIRWPWRTRLRLRVLHLTRWWRPRLVTAAIDIDAGSITVAYERWSWLQWKWVRE